MNSIKILLFSVIKEFNKTSTTERQGIELYSIQKALSRSFSLILLRVIFVKQAECLSYSPVTLILPLRLSKVITYTYIAALRRSIPEQLCHEKKYPC